MSVMAPPNGRFDDPSSNNIRAKLPVEIIYLILNFLSVTDRVHCSQTCKALERLILDSPAMWQDINFRYLKHDLLTSQLHDKPLCKVTIGYSYTHPSLQICPKYLLLPGLSDYIKELEIILGETTYLMRKFIITSSPAIPFSPEPELLNLIQLNRHSLHDLQMTCKQGCYIPMILNNCPNVKYLRWRMDTVGQAPCSSHPDEPFTFQGPFRLRHLSIHRGEAYNVTRKILLLLANCPNLETFYMICRTTPKKTRRRDGWLHFQDILLEALNQHCTRLRRVDFAHPEWQDSNDVEKAPCSVNNVQYVNRASTFEATYHAFPIILRLVPELQTLGLPLSYLSIEQWMHISNIDGFPQLKTLNLHWHSGLGARHLQAALEALTKSSTRTLDTVRIYSKGIVNGATVLNFLQHFSQLRSLELHGCILFHDNVLRTFVASAVGSNLRYLTLDDKASEYASALPNGYLSPTQALPIFALIPGLSYLRLVVNDTTSLNLKAIKKFAKAVRSSSSRLSHIRIETSYIPLDALQQLVSLPSLTYLYLQPLPGRGEVYFENLLEQESQELLLQSSPRLRRIITKPSEMHACPTMVFIDI